MDIDHIENCLENCLLQNNRSNYNPLSKYENEYHKIFDFKDTKSILILGENNPIDSAKVLISTDGNKYSHPYYLNEDINLLIDKYAVNKGSYTQEDIDNTKEYMDVKLKIKEAENKLSNLKNPKGIKGSAVRRQQVTKDTSIKRDLLKKEITSLKLKLNSIPTPRDDKRELIERFYGGQGAKISNYKSNF